MNEKATGDRRHRSVIFLAIAGWAMAACTVRAQPAQHERETMRTKDKLDLYKQHKEEYVTPKSPVVVDVGEARYLTIVGQGEPGGRAFVSKVGVLYSVAFTVKMKSKAAGRDYAVAKLEGLWWGAKSKHDFFGEPRSTWNWKLLIRTPVFITDKDVQNAAKTLADKGKDAGVNEVRLETISEGRCVQVLHVGPYSTETETIGRMTEVMKEEGLTQNGLHHEIYLSDPSKTAPEKLRTILRVPVK